MKLILYSFFFLFLNSFSLSAQSPISIKMGYSGEFLFHPGLEIGLEKPIRHQELFLERKEYTYKKEVLLNTNLSTYLHPHNHAGLLLDVGISFRSTRKISNTLGINLGWLSQFNLGKTFQINDAGEIETVPLANRGYFIPSFSYTLSKNLKNDSPVSIYGGLKVGAQLPYNKTIIPKVFLNLGVLYQLKKQPSNDR